MRDGHILHRFSYISRSFSISKVMALHQRISVFFRHVGSPVLIKQNHFGRKMRDGHILHRFSYISRSFSISKVMARRNIFS